MRITNVKKAQKDQGVCGNCKTPLLKGDSYRWIKFRYGGKRKRCTRHECRFRASDMTTSDKRSDFFYAHERIEDEVEALNNNLSGWTPEEIAGYLNAIAEMIESQIPDIENVADGYEESASNMEEHFPGSYQIDEIIEKAEQCRARIEEWEEKQTEVIEMAEQVGKCDFTMDDIQSLLDDLIYLAGDDPMW